MARIKVNTEGLQANISAISEKIAELQGFNANLDSLLNQIDASWEGAASVAYAARMRRYYSKTVEMIGVLEEFRKYMQEASSKFEQQDSAGAAGIRAC